MGNVYEFDQAIKLLFDDFSYLTIDLPGHGKTQVLDDECYTMASTATAIIQLLDQLKIDQCFLNVLVPRYFSLGALRKIEVVEPVLCCVVKYSNY